MWGFDVDFFAINIGVVLHNLPSLILIPQLFSFYALALGVAEVLFILKLHLHWAFLSSRGMHYKLRPRVLVKLKKPT
jgi:hypothetical protein